MNEQIILKKIDELKPDKNQPRKDFNKEDMKLFGESFKSIGMINPIEIDEHNTIITGESRWRAGKEVGMKEIKCIILKNLSAEDRLTRQLAENMARKSLSIVEQREAIKRLFSTISSNSRNSNSDQFYSQIARKIGCSQSWISQIMEVDKAQPDIREAVDKGELSISTAHEIMKLDNKEEQKQYAQKVIKGKIEHRTIRDEVKQIKESSPDVRKAILNEDITIEQAERISKLKDQEDRKQAIQEHKAIARVDKNIEFNVEKKITAKQKREFDKRLVEAGNWITSFRGSVTDTSRSLEKTIKILLISTKFIPIMDKNQKETLDQQLTRFLEILEKAEQLTEQIEEKIK